MLFENKIITSIWRALYNVANHPLSFTSADGQSRIDCDYQGRRYMKKVSIQGSVISHERYLYRGYLQIAALDMLNSQALIRRILWDPKEPSATRPLALLQDDKLYSYGHDFLKNVTELFDETSQITTTYDYSPYGSVTETSTTDTNTNNITQALQWSSEIYDFELALSYYNYRHYNPTDGRWINRDPLGEEETVNLYRFVKNNICLWFDYLGNGAQPITGGPASGSGDLTHELQNASRARGRSQEEALNESTAAPSQLVNMFISPIACHRCPKDTRTRFISERTRCCEYRTKIQKHGHKTSSNGCGPAFFPVPDSFNLTGTSFDFSSACNAHDICYDTCGSDKKTCDRTFLSDMTKACYDAMKGYGSDLLMLVPCSKLASTYYYAVKIMDIAYNLAQDKACEWRSCDKGKN